MQYSVHVALSSSHHREIFYSVCLNKLNKEISFIYLFGFQRNITLATNVRFSMARLVISRVTAAAKFTRELLATADTTVVQNWIKRDDKRRTAVATVKWKFPFP